MPRIDNLQGFPKKGGVFCCLCSFCKRRLDSFLGYFSSNFFSKRKDVGADVWIISDGAHRVVQSTEVVRALGVARARIIEDVSVTEAGGVQSYFADAVKSKVWPALVVASGTEAGVISTMVKELSDGRTHNVQLLDPVAERDKYDLIAIPSHELQTSRQSLTRAKMDDVVDDNIMRTLGIVNKVNSALLQQELIAVRAGEYPELQDNYLTEEHSQHKHKIISVLVGGHYLGGDLTAENCAELLAGLDELAKIRNIRLLITTSPRTNVELAELLQQQYASRSSCHLVYNWKRNRFHRNPYLAMLALADAVVVTGDSVRMCSEACSSGRPTYIFTPKKQDYYALLRAHLYESGQAKKFDAATIRQDIMTKNLWQPEPLNEAQRVAEEILRRGLYTSPGDHHKKSPQKA